MAWVQRTFCLTFYVPSFGPRHTVPENAHWICCVFLYNLIFGPSLAYMIYIKEPFMDIIYSHLDQGPTGWSFCPRRNRETCVLLKLDRLLNLYGIRVVNVTDLCSLILALCRPQISLPSALVKALRSIIYIYRKL